MALRPKADQRTALRARIVLGCTAGESNAAVAAKLGVTIQTVDKWRQGFLDGQLGTLGDATHSSAPRRITDDNADPVITRILERRPKNKNATHWNTLTMAESSGLSQNSIERNSLTFGLKPHLQENSELSIEPFFAEKFRYIVGLYLNPHDGTRPVVMCVDGNSQVQALDRSQPVRPMRPGQAERRTHDYYLHGKTSLFAALDIATGKVIVRYHKQHHHQEYLRFLDQSDCTMAEGLDIHLVLDNCATQKTPKVAAWFQKRPRYHFHFTPTSRSWLSQVERWFGKIAQ